MVLHEIKPGWTITKEWEGYSIDGRRDLCRDQAEEYAGIFFSGGRAPNTFAKTRTCCASRAGSGKTEIPCASVCHGVEIPARAGIVQGLRMATVAKCKFDLEICGGIYVNEPCVIDQHMFSGRTYHDSGHFVGPWIKAMDAQRKAVIIYSHAMHSRRHFLHTALGLAAAASSCLCCCFSERHQPGLQSLWHEDAAAGCGAEDMR